MTIRGVCREALPFVQRSDVVLELLLVLDNVRLFATPHYSGLPTAVQLPWWKASNLTIRVCFTGLLLGNRG